TNWVSVSTMASSQGCLPPPKGKRAQYSISTRDGHLPGSIPGRNGNSSGRSTNQPNVLTARAAELSGLPNFPPSSLPAAFHSRSRTCPTGTPSRNALWLTSSFNRPPQQPRFAARSCRDGSSSARGDRQLSQPYGPRVGSGGGGSASDHPLHDLKICLEHA